MALLAVALVVAGVQLANPHSYLSEAVARTVLAGSSQSTIDAPCECNLTGRIPTRAPIAVDRDVSVRVRLAEVRCSA